MLTSLPIPRLGAYIARQINQFFPDGGDVDAETVVTLLDGLLPAFEDGLSHYHNPGFWKDGQVRLNHLHGDQYALLLYRLGHEAGRAGLRDLADKSYLLNKALHGLDLYHQVELPRACWLAHPVGSMIGRATYQGPLVVMQGCTLGNRGGEYPVIGSRVILCAQSSIIGACEIGDNVCIGAGSLLVNEKVPSGCTVVGRTPYIRIIEKRPVIHDTVFRSV